MKTIIRMFSILLTGFLLLCITIPGIATEERFTDVKPSAYFFEAVFWAVENGITAGTSDTTFSPGKGCTRAEIMTFLWRAAGSPAHSSSEDVFQDVSSNAYYHDAVLWAAENNITSGTGADQFSPDAVCTRSQVAVFLWHFAGNPKPVASSSLFSDVKDSSYYCEAVCWAIEQGISAGTSVSTFSPNVTCTRGQIVTFLWRLVSSSTGELTENCFQCGEEEIDYLLYQPENAAPGMPLIVYLHGGSGKGSDLALLTANDGFPQYLKDGKLGSVPAYVIIPQLNSNYKGWVEAKELLISLIDDVVGTYAIDKNRISLTGHSMGGTGTWNVAAAYPEKFSKIMPLSGSVRTTEATLSAFSSMPIWTFVGEADTIVDPESTRAFVAQLLPRNPDARLTELDGADHFAIPALVYLSDDYKVIAWLIE